MKLSDFNLYDILTYLRNFHYTKEINGEQVSVDAELIPLNQLPTFHKYFLDKYGSLRADNIMFAYKNDEITAEDLAELIKSINYSKWVHYLGMWTAEYNPIWNVDGKEVRTIKTEYGKITEMSKGTTTTFEQMENSEVISEQLTDSTNTHSVAPQDSSNFNPKERDVSNMGKSKNVSDAGKTENRLTGKDTDTNKGEDNVTDTFIRGGNIGVTMTQQLLEAEKSFWTKMDFYDMWMKSIVENITIPIWED